MRRRKFLQRMIATVAAVPADEKESRSISNKLGDPLAGQVTIYRDEFGVPHIVGEPEEATFFGYGYAQAQDHLEKMMLQYRRGVGVAVQNRSVVRQFSARAPCRDRVKRFVRAGLAPTPPRRKTSASPNSSET